MEVKVFDVLTPERAQEIRDLLMQHDWKEGKARTAELTGTIKQNLELKPGEDGDLVTKLSQECTGKVTQDPGVVPFVLPKQSTLFKFNNYKDTGTYNRHTDAPFMGPVRTDFACTVFLTDPDSYEGGVLNIESDFGDIIEVKGKQGQAVVYRCGRPHWVTPVTKGERICAIGWIQSAVKEPWKREVLRDLLRLSRDLESKMDYEGGNEREWFVDVGKVHSALHRQWSER